MTLLALDLKPDLPTGASSRELGRYLREHGSQYGSFALAFAVIAQFWLTHHRVMNPVRRATRPLVSANLVFLFGITLLPLTTYLQGNYAGSLAVTLFAANILLISLSLAVIRAIVVRHGLDDRHESAVQRLERVTRGATILVIPVLVAGLSWVLGGQATWFFLLFFVPDNVVAVARRLRR